MDYSLYDPNQSPLQQQQMMAEILRARSRGADQDALVAANQRGHRFDPLAAASTMMNNPAAMDAAQAAQKSALLAAKPAQMGTQGFMLPETGQFVESPMYVDEKNAARQASKDMADARLSEQSRRSGEDRALRLTLAQMNEEGRNERAAEARALRMTIAGMMGNRANEKADEKKTGDLDKAVTKYSATLEKAGVPEFDEALGIAEGRLKKHKMGELPGYGRFEGAVPNWAANPEQQMTRSDMQAAANILLKSRSGAAVTDSEMRRFLTEVATGAGMTEEAMRHGWENVRRQFDAKRRAIAAGASPDVHTEFMNRGGRDYRVMNAPDASVAPASDDDLINKYLPKGK